MNRINRRIMEATFLSLLLCAVVGRSLPAAEALFSITVSGLYTTVFSPDSRTLAILTETEVHLVNLQPVVHRRLRLPEPTNALPLGEADEIGEAPAGQSVVSHPQLLWQADSQSFVCLVPGMSTHEYITREYSLNHKKWVVWNHHRDKRFLEPKLIRHPDLPVYFQSFRNAVTEDVTANMPLGVCFNASQTSPARVPAIDELGEAAFSKDGRYVVGASNQGKVYAWDARTGERLAIIPTEQEFYLTITGHGNDFAAGGSDGSIITWSGQPLQRHATWRVIAGNRRIPEIVAGSLPPFPNRNFFFPSGNFVTCLRFSPDGSRLAAAWQDGTVAVLDRHTESVRWHRRRDNGYMELEWLQGNALAVTGHPLGTVVYSDTGELLYFADEDETWDAVSRDLKWATQLEPDEKLENAVVTLVPLQGP